MYNTLQPLPSLLLPLSSPRRSLPHLTTITTTTTTIASNSHQPHSHNSKHDQPRQRPLQPSNVATRRVGRDDRGGCYCFSTVSLGLSTASSYLVGKMVTTTVGNETREEKGKEKRGKGQQTGNSRRGGGRRGRRENGRRRGDGGDGAGFGARRDCLTRHEGCGAESDESGGGEAHFVESGRGLGWVGLGWVWVSRGIKRIFLSKKRLGIFITDTE